MEIITFLILLFVFFIYMLPTFILSVRGTMRSDLVLLNVFIGWTVVGWFAALILCMVAKPKP